MECVEPWFATWFGEEYLALYPERNDKEAQRQVRFAAEALAPFARFGRTGFLDLACGTGRHAVALDAGIGGVVGLDPSLPRLADARKRAERPHPGYVRADRRKLPFREGAFGAVVNFFTAFGNFEAEEDDLAVLREVRRVLAPGGAFLSDVFNAARVIATLATREEKTIAGQRIAIARRYEPERKRVEKVIEIGEGAGAHCYREKVRAYTAEDLRELHKRAGLAVRRSYGDFDGSPFDVKRSPRLILLAVRPEAA